MIAIYKSDYKKIEKLQKLTNPVTFWDDVRKLTKNTYSDFHIGRWQCLAETRYDEISKNKNTKENNITFEVNILDSEGHTITSKIFSCIENAIIQYNKLLADKELVQNINDENFITLWTYFNADKSGTKIIKGDSKNEKTKF